jgi:hypothetical protein
MRHLTGVAVRYVVLGGEIIVMGESMLVDGRVIE